MKKTLKGLLAAALAVSTTVSFNINASGAHDHNQTYMNTRSHGVNLALINGPGVNEVIHRKDKDKFGGNFQVIGWYSDGDADGHYWAPFKQDQFAFRINAGTTAITDADKNLDIRNFRHGSAAASAEVGKIKLDPEQQAYGFTFNYDQRLDSILKGLYLNVTIPVVHVENDLQATFDGTEKDFLRDYLKGKFEDQTANGSNKQDKLKKALIDGDDDETGVADIDIVLGYTFLNKKNYKASLNLGFTIPTGTDADGNKAFEAVVGNGQKFGFGAGMTFDARVWGDKMHNFMLYVALKYRYLFESSETRTLGIRQSDKVLPWGHYRLLVKRNATGQHVQGTALMPAANVTTLNVDVEPGSEFDGIIALAYNNGGFGANLGYNLYFREDESVKLKAANPFKDGLGYALPDADFDTDAATGAITAAGGARPATALAEKDLDVSRAETPSQTTHKIYGGVAWTFKDWETPVNLGLGAHYEFADQDEAIEGWGINGRIGIGF